MPALATTISTGPSSSYIGADGQRALGGFAVAGGHSDLVACGDEFLGDGAADAAVAAGDEDDA